MNISWNCLGRKDYPGQRKPGIDCPVRSIYVLKGAKRKDCEKSVNRLKKMTMNCQRFCVHKKEEK